MLEWPSGAEQPELPVVTAARCRVRRKRRVAESVPKTVRGMFWNCRGLETELLLLKDYMRSKAVSFACLCETKVCGADLSCSEWIWIPGPETLPKMGSALPRMGLGVLADRRMFPSAAAVKTGKYTVWVRLQGADADFFICAAYAPVYVAQKMAAFEEVIASSQTFRGKGLIAIGGDFNARCGYNGDAVVSSEGKRLVGMCQEAGLTLVNSLADICKGDFTRVQKACVDGVDTTFRTTIDYVLVPSEQEDRTISLTIDEESGLDSDHRRLLLNTLAPGPPTWDPARDASSGAAVCC